METSKMSLLDTIQRVCQDLPEDFVVTINMENGSAWIELVDADGQMCRLPDSTDKTLQMQLNDAFSEAQKMLTSIPEPDVILGLKNTERDNILFALRLWVKEYGLKMISGTRNDLIQLIEKIDCAGSKL
jgi:hypothetical protein